MQTLQLLQLFWRVGDCPHPHAYSLDFQIVVCLQATIYPCVPRHLPQAHLPRRRYRPYRPVLPLVTQRHPEPFDDQAQQLWSPRSSARLTSNSIAMSRIVIGSVACRRTNSTFRLISPRCAHSFGGWNALGRIVSTWKSGANWRLVASWFSRSATSLGRASCVASIWPARSARPPGLS